MNRFVWSQENFTRAPPPFHHPPWGQAADPALLTPTPLTKPRSCLPNSISNPEPRFEGRGTRPWFLGFVRYFVWWKDLSNKRLLYAIHAVSMGSWLRIQGGVPLRVWDRLGVTAQEDTLLIRTSVCIGLNLDHTQKRLLGKRSLNLGCYPNCYPE